MHIGTSIFLIALGIIGLVLSLVQMMVWSDRRRRPDETDVEQRRYRDPAA
jgi:heme/copper-type cytochrome/quinol oxidase subunit 2